MLNDALEDAPQSYATVKKHVSIALSIHEFPLTPTYQAFFRDGYRCVVTGKYDINSLLKIKELRENFAAHGHHSSGMDATQCTHIFAESTNHNIEPDSQKVCRYLSAQIFDDNILNIAGLGCHDVGGQDRKSVV